MVEGEEETDLVADLLSRAFSRWAFQEKLDIVQKGWATPKLASLSQRGFVCRFQVTNYEWYRCRTLTSNGAFQNVWENHRGSTAE